MSNKNIITSNFPDIVTADSGGNILGLTVDKITTGEISSPSGMSFTGNVNLGQISNVRILGGSSGQTIVTDGSGNLSWGAGGGGSTPGGANRSVQYNIDGSFTGTGSFSYDPAADTLYALRANVNNANIGSIYMTGNISNVDYLDFDTSSIAVDSTARMKWSAEYATMDVGLLNNVVLQIGQESHYYIKAGPGGILKGQVVQFSGAQGDVIFGIPANTSSPGFVARYVMGVAPEDIPAGTFGYVVSFGRVNEVGTFYYPEGSILYLKPNSQGELQTNEPAAPNPKVVVAACLIQSPSPSATNGRLLVRPDWSYRLQDLQDFQTATPNVGDVIVRGSGGVWESRDSVPLANVATTAVTVTQNNQPNITSVGTLTNLTVSGNLDADAIVHANSKITVGNGVQFSTGSNANLFTFGGNAAQQLVQFYNTNANIRVIGQSIVFNDAVSSDSSGIFPSTNGEKFLGGSAFRWGNIFGVNGDLSGNITGGNIGAANGAVTFRTTTVSANGISSSSGTTVTTDWTKSIQTFTQSGGLTTITVSNPPGPGRTLTFIVNVASSQNITILGVPAGRISSGVTSFIPRSNSACHLTFRSLDSTAGNCYIEISAI
jgi:hypothetical protein